MISVNRINTHTHTCTHPHICTHTHIHAHTHSEEKQRHKQWLWGFEGSEWATLQILSTWAPFPRLRRLPLEDKHVHIHSNCCRSVCYYYGTNEESRAWEGSHVWPPSHSISRVQLSLKTFDSAFMESIKENRIYLKKIYINMLNLMHEPVRKAVSVRIFCILSGGWSCFLV